MGVDDRLTAVEQPPVGRLEGLVDVVGEDFGQGRLGGGHHQWVAVEGAVLLDRAVGDDRGQLGGHPDRPARVAAAARLGQGDHVRGDAEAAGGAAGGDRAAGLDLVEDQLHAVRRGQLADALEVALLGRDDVDVHHRRLHDQPGDLVADLVEDALQRLGVVEGDGAGQFGQRQGDAAAVRHAERVVALAERLERRVDRDHHRVVVAVVGALDLQHRVAAGGAAGEVDGVHRRLGAGVVEAPLRQSEAASELARHRDRAVGGGGEVGAFVDPRLDRVADGRVGVADAHHAEAVVEVDVFVLVDVPDAAAAAAREVDRPGVALLEGGGDAVGHHLDRALEGPRRLAGPVAQLLLLPLGQRGDALAVDPGHGISLAAPHRPHG